MRFGRVLQGFQEGPYNFAPTFKVKRFREFAEGESGTVHRDYRIPSYCDRILWKSRLPRTIAQLFQTSVPEVTTSDHKPVRAEFAIVFPSVSGLDFGPSTSWPRYVTASLSFTLVLCRFCAVKYTFFLYNHVLNRQPAPAEEALQILFTGLHGNKLIGFTQGPPTAADGETGDEEPAAKGVGSLPWSVGLNSTPPVVLTVDTGLFSFSF
jgi:hypothetical protein